MPKGKGVITIPLESLKNFLMLPKDYTLSHVYYDDLTELVGIVVNHPAIPDGGSRLADVLPLYAVDTTEKGYLTTLTGIRFFPESDRGDVDQPARNYTNHLESSL